MKKTSSGSKSHHEDSLLVGKAKEDKAEFASLYRKYFQRVYTYVSRRVRGNPDLAEDVTQDTFVCALRKLPQFQIRGHSYLSYLLRIARNLLLTHYRKKKPTLLQGQEDALADEKTNLERDISQKFEDALVQQGIARLSASEQEFLSLRYRHQFSCGKWLKSSRKAKMR